MEDEKPTIMTIAETHLDKEDELELPGYKTWRKDRNKEGGGIAVAVRDRLSGAVLEIEAKETKAEIMWMKIGWMKLGLVIHRSAEQKRKKWK